MSKQKRRCILFGNMFHGIIGALKKTRVKIKFQTRRQLERLSATGSNHFCDSSKYGIFPTLENIVQDVLSATQLSYSGSDSNNPVMICQTPVQAPSTLTHVGRTSGKGCTHTNFAFCPLSTVDSIAVLFVAFFLKRVSREKQKSFLKTTQRQNKVATDSEEDFSKVLCRLRSSYIPFFTNCASPSTSFFFSAEYTLVCMNRVASQHNYQPLFF